MNRNALLKLTLLCLSLLAVAGSCKKKKAFKEENGQAAEDVRNFQSQNDEIIADVNTAIMQQSLLRGRSSSESGWSESTTGLCGAEADTTRVGEGVIALNYNGASCNGIVKTGKVIVSIIEYPSKKWKHQGCTLKLDFFAYKVTGTNGKIVQVDGTEYLVNESGNTWYEMKNGLTAKPLVQIHMADELIIKLDDSKTVLFNFNRRLTFTYSEPNKVTTCKVEGLGASGGKTNLDNWGKNRDGKDFTTEVISPVVWTSACGSRKPVGGAVNVSVEENDFEMKCRFAVDADGATDESGNCPFGWKVSWSYKKKTTTRLFAYN